nr:hypothetical protein [Tanacetum cinerariifolium]
PATPLPPATTAATSGRRQKNFPAGFFRRNPKDSPSSDLSDPLCHAPPRAIIISVAATSAAATSATPTSQPPLHAPQRHHHPQQPAATHDSHHLSLPLYAAPPSPP